MSSLYNILVGTVGNCAYSSDQTISGRSEPPRTPVASPCAQPYYSWKLSQMEMAADEVYGVTVGATNTFLFLKTE